MRSGIPPFAHGIVRVAIVVHYRIEVPMLRSLRGALIRKPARPQPAPLPQAEAVLEIRS